MKKLFILFIILFLVGGTVLASTGGKIRFSGPYRHYQIFIDGRLYEHQGFGFDQDALVKPGQHSILVKTRDGITVLDQKIDVKDNGVTKVKIPKKVK